MSKRTDAEKTKKHQTNRSTLSQQIDPSVEPAVIFSTKSPSKLQTLRLRPLLPESESCLSLGRDHARPELRIQSNLKKDLKS